MVNRPPDTRHGPPGNNRTVSIDSRKGLTYQLRRWRRTELPSDAVALARFLMKSRVRHHILRYEKRRTMAGRSVASDFGWRLNGFHAQECEFVADGDDALDGSQHVRAMVADEHDQRALLTAAIGQCPAAAIHSQELEVRGGLAEVA